ncbi:MAG: hypothetical protein ABIU55_12400 [Ferruginibacter sp.]
MEQFINQTLSLYFPLYEQHAIINGYRIRRLNVYIDFIEELLVKQFEYYNDNSDLMQIDTEPDKEAFKVFSIAWLELEKKRTWLKESTDYEHMIDEMQKLFLQQAIPQGYHEEHQFTIMYIPLVKELKLSKVPGELLLLAENKVLRN